ncbi:MAG: PilC/PilY family type IV pilus protein [Gammaproteobacteria bacterium]|nr:PilC/PilY family type IV pilus protein [Gammaproteobacteria bacterium]
MRTLFKKFTLSLATSLYILMASPVMAEDTELFIGLSAGTNEVRPNILFIIDTSGSMDGDVIVPTGTYQPGTTYSGACSSSRYYYSTSGNPPNCSYTTSYIPVADYHCADASSALGSTGSGYYVGRHARYRNSSPDYWTSFYRYYGDQFECEADYGNHGDGTAGEVYPANESNGGPWNSTDTNSISWTSTGSIYTIYTANYINFLNTAGNSETWTRLQVVQHALKNIIDSTSGINAALMRFDSRYSGNEGGYFVQGMKEMTTTPTDTRTPFKASIDALDHEGYTPLAETLYEAMLYYQGKAPHFGNNALPDGNVAEVIVNSSDVAADPDLVVGNYKSPIEFQCQKNFVVLLTDGTPVNDDDADTLVNTIPNFTTLTGNGTACAHSADNCLDEIAHFMYETDQDLKQGDQNVSTYTIGFATNQTLLYDTALKGGSTGGIGGSGYFLANSLEGLTSAFTSIITNILAINSTFVAPAVSVNAFNRLTHRNELYFALFRPEESTRWSGNLKRYKLMRSDPLDLTSELIVADVNDEDAVDPATGFFKDTAQSYWSSTIDGSDVSLGGAAENLPLDRTVYTYTGATAANNSPLNIDTNKLHEDNDVSDAGGTGTLTNTLLGLAATTTDADRIELIKWARGIDIHDDDEDNSTTDARQFIADPLHSKPNVVTYAGTDETDLDVTVYITTNEGHLHAIAAETGVEQFSFVPTELLPNLNVMKINQSTGFHTYGLDGPLTTWHNDLNNNLKLMDSAGNIDTVDSVEEHIYLYFGMRRGGNNYYALDVTNRNSPKLKWVIKGGVDGGDFEELAQTWSKPTLAKIMFNGHPENVLIFGGGYDTTQDNASLPADDVVGRAIYIVDADTGVRLWWAGPTGSGANLELADMKNSIAADIKLVDSNLNGVIDRLYTTDLGARVWRVDLDEDHTGNDANTLATAGAIADLGGADAENNRRFYYAPSVSFAARHGERFYAIAVGSGYRSHPLDAVIQDRFYMIRDTDIDVGPPKDADGNPTSYTTLTEADLYDATDNTIGEGDQTQSAAATSSLTSSHGWYFELNELDGSYIGEKVMSSPVTFAGVIIFPTFTPVASTDSTSCAPSQGTSYGYVVSLYDATPVFNYDSNPDLTRVDRRTELKGLPTEPSIIFVEGGMTAFFGTQQLPKGNNTTGCTDLTCLHEQSEGKQGGRDTKYITESVDIRNP